MATAQPTPSAFSGLPGQLQTVLGFGAGPVTPNQAPGSNPGDYLNSLYPNSGLPANPGYTGLTDANGNLLDQYKLTGSPSIMPQFQGMLDSSKYDPTALNALTGMATSAGASPWASVAMDLNKANTASQLGAAGATENSAEAAARSSLASKGGLRQGAALSLAKSGAKNLLGSKQNIWNQSNLNNLGVLSQDATNKMGMLGTAVTGAGQQASLGQNAANLWATTAGADRNYNTAVDQSNIAALAQNNQGQNAYNQGTYNTNMNAWAANQQANADADAAKHSGGLFGGGGFLGLGSWICTEVNNLEALPAEVITELKDLRHDSLVHAPGRAGFYLNGAGGLLRKMQSEGYDFSKEREFVLSVARLHQEDPKAAVEMYWNRVCELMKEWGV